MVVVVSAKKKKRKKAEGASWGLRGSQPEKAARNIKQ